MFCICAVPYQNSPYNIEFFIKIEVYVYVFRNFAILSSNDSKTAQGEVSMSIVKHSLALKLSTQLETEHSILPKAFYSLYNKLFYGGLKNMASRCW